MFKAWQDGIEWKSIENFQTVRSKIPELERACVDVCFDMKEYLNTLFQLICDLKVPKKSKGRKYF